MGLAHPFRRALLAALAALLCASCASPACAPGPSDALGGYQSVASSTERLIGQELFSYAYTRLASHPPGTGTILDGGSRQVLNALNQDGIDATKTTMRELTADQGFAQLQRQITTTGAIARQTDTIMDRLADTLRTEADRLPADDMQSWRDDLATRLRTETRRALLADPTVRATIRLQQPTWNGSFERIPGEAGRDLADLVNTIEGDITTSVQDSLTAACRSDS